MTVGYDNNGNLTKDENGQQYVYDEWNRLVAVKNAAGTTIITYSYDPFGRRITETPSGVTTKDLYLDTSGRVLEERQGSTVTDQNVWGLGYTNDLVLRDDNSTSGNYGKTGLGRRLFAQQDTVFNVTSLIAPGGSVQERYQYDPYGTVTVLNANFTVRGTGLPSASTFSWQYLFQDGRLDTTSLMYHFGRRDYSTTLGRWLQPDGGYWDGANLYQADGSSPEDRVDPLGQSTIQSGASGTVQEWVKMVVRNKDGSITTKWVLRTISLPPGTEPTPMRFRWTGGSRVVQVPAGGSRTVTFPLDSKGVWELHFSTTQTGALGDGRAISVKAAEPLLRRA